MPADIKGYRMKFIVDEVRTRSGEDGVAKLKKLYGKDLLFISRTVYSEEDNIRLLLAFSQVIFGDTDPQSLFETGRILAQTILRSFLLKTGLKLMEKQTLEDLIFSQKIARFIDLLVKNFAPNLHVEVENPDGKTLHVRFKDTAMPPKIYEGEWNEYFQILCGGIHINSEVISNREFEINLMSKSGFQEEVKRFQSFIEIS